MPPVPKGKLLTDKEAALVREYLVDNNITQAAIRAGYNPRSAVKSGSEALARPRVQAAIAEALKAQEKRTLVTADANLIAIERLATTAEKDGEYAAAIRARELIGKHYKSFTDKLEVRDTTPRADRLAAARARRQERGG